jgi:hypothetical protein
LKTTLTTPRQIGVVSKQSCSNAVRLMIENLKNGATNIKVPRRRVTLDSQLMSYWEREARRLDVMAANARWGWMARTYARKAERARTQGARSAAREAERRAGAAPGPQEGEPQT